MTGAGRLPLVGFKQPEMPDEMCLKLKYSDFRSMTASTNQAEYVYRGNSLFDCDFTGVGGQPQGFDQWKTLYGVYRVMAVKTKVQAVGGNGFGVVTIAPTTSSGAFSSAEEVAGLRKAKTQVFTTQQRASVEATWHTGEVLGKEDVAVLSDPNDSAAVTTNPTEQFFVHVAAETTGASDIVYFWIELTYYVRLEAPLSTLDTFIRHSRLFQAACAGADLSSVTSAVVSAAPICGATTITRDAPRPLVRSMLRL